MFTLINLFYNTKELNKLLIIKSYNDLKNEIINFNKQYPNFNGNIIGEKFNNEKEENEWYIYKKNFNKLEKIVINNLLNYSINYPNEKISKNRFISEYYEFPYRLEQSLEDVIKEL